MKIKFVNGLNVFMAPEEIAETFMKKLKVPRGYCILEKNTKLEEIQKRLNKKENLVIYSHNEEIINIADCLHGIGNKEVISLKV